MSGLEPLAALGLACNIMQMITFTGETISICRRIYNDGQPDSGLHDYSQRLLRTSESLRDIISRSTGNLSLDDHALRNSAARCINVADNLMKEMESLSIPRSQNGLRSSLRQGVKMIFHKPRLERLENDLRNIQSAMHTQLLVRTLDRLDVSAIQQQGAVAESRRLLDDTLRQYSAKHDNFAKENLETRDQLLKAVTAATARMEEHITRELSKHSQSIQGQMGTIAIHTQQHATNFKEWANSAAEETAYERILQSLKFDSMEERRNQICENYPKTFGWIYAPRPQKPTTSERSESQGSSSTDEADNKSSRLGPSEAGWGWDSFTDWLRSEDPVYWISGKPGSGKSTLMKFISSNPQTQAGLNEWQPGTRILSHYFWKAGSQLQHSVKGFLSSLVYQIFRQDRSAALAYLQQTPGLSHHLSSTSDWGMGQLKSFLLGYIRQSTTPICIFVDGLDELVPQHDIHDLLCLLDDLLGLGLKLCVSSRPERVFKNHLRHHKTLKMHDLVEPDIAEYARGTLCRAISPTYQEFDITSLVKSIIDKAEGVFLWVVLVSKSLVRGIENGDSNGELQQRLNSMPSDLMLLYKDMWQRSNEDHEIYKTKSYWYFNIYLV
ncbi:NACHT domain-containing [Fusarium albosuccineum]|uniref:NACHT domain-containing n=1 Tax=Fusarium albosuccineum TaxID=1237068 RepID=A0A8H4PKS4_9HYPO|nr:NACHT domain-containing [Fusarium albosuccineum]